MKTGLGKPRSLWESRFLPHLISLFFSFPAFLSLLDSAKFPLKNMPDFADRGGALVNAVISKAISFSMPLVQIIACFAEYRVPWGSGFFYACFAALLLYCVFWLVFKTGERMGGRLAGVFSALLSFIFLRTWGVLDFEQIVYAFTLSVFAYFLLLRLRHCRFSESFLAGIFLGLTLLVRSPLFLFPFLVIAADRLYFGKKFSLRKEIALFLAGYVVLLPWLAINWKLHREIIPFEKGKAAANIITGAKGAIFTMEGDARELAGIARGDSVYAWAVREIKANPLSYVKAVFLRIWRIFLFLPFLFLFSFLGIIRKRDPKTAYFSVLILYFILVHSLMSIEKRYFFPLIFLLSPPASVFLSSFFGKKSAGGDGKVSFLNIPFAVSLFLLLAAETVMIRWIFRAGPELSLISAGENGDAWIFKKRAKIFFSLGIWKKGVAELRKAWLMNPRKESFAGNVVKILEAGEPEDIIHMRPDYNLDILRMLKFLEWGDLKEAGILFERIYGKWNREMNTLRGVVTSEDRKILNEIHETNKTLWDYHIYGGLLLFPANERKAIIENLSKITEITPKIKALAKRGFPEDFDFNGTYRFCLESVSSFVKSSCRDKTGDEFDGRILNADYYLGLNGRDMNMHPEEVRDILLLCSDSAGENFRANLSEMAAKYRKIYLYSVLYSLSRCSGWEKSPGFLLDKAFYYSQRNLKKARILVKDIDAGKLDEREKFRLALVFQNTGEYQKGLEIANELLAVTESAENFNLRGVFNMLLGRNGEAEKDFMRAIAVDDSMWQAKMNLAGLYLREKRRAGAEKLYHEIIASGAPRTVKNDAKAALKGIK